MRGRRLPVAVAAILAVLVAAGADAAVPPSGGPDLSTMALAANDLGPGARISAQGYRTPTEPAVASYEREFGPGVRLGGRPVLVVANTNDAFPDAGTAAQIFGELKDGLGTTAKRTAFGKAVVQGFNADSGGALRATLVGVGNLVPIPLGQGAFRILIRMKTRIGTLDLALGALLLDRALGLVVLASYPKKHIAAATTAAALGKLAPHFQYGFTVRNLTPPTIAGTPQAGQTLTADPGQWGGAPSSFAYQWSRCDANGANCTPIAGAVGQTYVLGTAEVGTRVSVTVTAANTVTSQAMPAAATTAVK